MLLPYSVDLPYSNPLDPTVFSSFQMGVSLLLLLLSSPLLEAVFDCAPHETTAFIRSPRTRLAGTPVVVSTAGMISHSFDG